MIFILFLDADTISQLRQSIQVLLDSRTSLSPSQTDRNVHRISENLSNLVIYCQAVSWSEELFNKITQTENQTTQKEIFRDIQQMSSIGELKIKKYTRKRFRNSRNYFDKFQFRWSKNSVTEMWNTASSPSVFNHLK